MDIFLLSLALAGIGAVGLLKKKKKKKKSHPKAPSGVKNVRLEII